IAASGMCSGGRIVNYLKVLIEDQRTDILFVGYQAQGTPGRTIQKYGPRKNGSNNSRVGWVELEGKKYDINAEVHTISGYSAHADQRNLVNFIKRMRHKPTDIRLVHGDAEAKASLAAMIKDQLAISNVTIP
ncbi:MAG TPA: MBL fold metallo-hydrolase, partial [Gammaproteobacteria bacterium]|nr:MBL fold metallo-hydrolase [Gammaproteobacteria bacterium]